ncbi:uncharacterized protein LOC116178316 isoform X2 [Photinus pyralis]|uniref:DUF4806 domain-containing protein n=2 Tax=Photinus pyralis TaxID=7054 RepID=A0A1Y1K6I5_PHOPY|nr:uncharacterized protein LOC116175948 isoform X2 [Photinus pyralis]XP_031350196.1 uncharacterized protein LOC116175948 isoform X2 [Photinus pyralis]XP_031350261.1 uncharacterized protein LOC116175989 isoform X2 [Photinus pyralis]XP_031350262.1 uncharacterized protein LOC116175989 isoform X2 [Photinus pyralis]XP_031353662.1 uncharacterized protein LOC116178316 isoform X2 [Photinus pyralis]XP_031353669.1 uncharacterized protein LOC116178316 isoform X2 [Photinus pyralis]
MAFVGVEFTENGTVGLVHSSWFTPFKREVFWPPYKTSNTFNRALTNAEEPDQSNWTLHAVKRSFFECDDIDKARKKLKICEVTSDIQSEPEGLYQDCSGKRSARVRKPRVVYSSDSEGEEARHKSLPKPPAFQQLNLRKPDPSQSRSSNNGIVVHSITPVVARTEHNRLPTPVNAEHLNENASLNPGNVEKIFQEIKKLREELKEIKAFIKQSRNADVAALPDDIPVEFPLNAVAHMQRLDEYLSAEDKRNSLALYLSSLGGSGTIPKVNKILRFLMTNNLATQYNFVGQRRNKIAFGSTQLQSVIIRAVQIKSPATTQSEIESAVKIWLKHSKQRMEKRGVSGNQ